MIDPLVVLIVVGAVLLALVAVAFAAGILVGSRWLDRRVSRRRVDPLAGATIVAVPPDR